MKFRSSVIIFALLVFAVQAMAVPARRGLYTYTQPDGTSFQAFLSGDEFSKSLKTFDGCFITMDRSGYYCYAEMDAHGSIRSSGIRVCRENSTSEAAVLSRTITRKGSGRAVRKTADHLRSLAAVPQTKAAVEKRKNVILLVQFDDLRFKYSKSNFQEMLTGQSYPTGSALKYFNDQFEGKYDFEFAVSSIVTLSKGYAYYGENDDEGNDKRAAELVVDACKQAASEIDFSRYDGDGDGEVDNVFIFVPGINEAEGASADHIWPHQWYLYDGAGINLVIGGKRINSYAVTSELTYEQSSRTTIFATIGTFCHEYSHSLGLLDHYDTDYEDSGGDTNSYTNSSDLMGYGNYNNDGKTPPNFNALELESFGLGVEESIEPGDYVLPPLGSQKRYIRLDTDKKGEYFLFECRESSGWDKYIGGSGMLVYHVDMSSNPAGYSDFLKTSLTAEERWWNNQVNCNPDHMCFDIIEAIPIARDVSQAFWPNGTHNAFSPSTKPAFQFWSGGSPEISIIGIKKSGSNITFTAAGPLSLEKVEEFQDAAIVLWTSTNPSAETRISIQSPSGSTVSHIVKPYSEGRYSYTFEGLNPKTTYKITISSEVSDSVIATEFTTKAYYTDGYPFIYLNSAQRNQDGSFVKGTTMPLRVFNAENAVKVKWSLNSGILSDDGSGYYTVVGSGTIKATIEYKDGTREIISKTITVK